jgi:hypothetical protein
METSTAVTAAPVVTKSENTVAESSQETKVEQIANGTIEMSANTEKSVTQSVMTSNDQNG